MVIKRKVQRTQPIQKKFKYTRLHFVLTMLVAGAVILILVSIWPEKKKKVEPVAVKQETAAKPEMSLAEKDIRARKAIAVAGEYWKIAKKEDRDRFDGEATLRRAKSEYKYSNYDEAVRLARLSIQQLKYAPKLGVQYQVRYKDCLWNIAKMKEHYGKGAMWVRIWRANIEIIPDFDLIHPRQNLFIPGVRRKIS